MFVSVFFFKQKTAYEMRISDWSSDVCSSDLIAIPMDNIGGAFAFVSQDQRSREMLPSAQWARLMSAISGIRDRGGWVSAVIVDPPNATLHGEDNRAAVIQEYVRAIAPISGELGADFVGQPHIRTQARTSAGSGKGVAVRVDT